MPTLSRRAAKVFIKQPDYYSPITVRPCSVDPRYLFYSQTIFDQSERCRQANGDGRPHYFEEQPRYLFSSQTIKVQSQCSPVMPQANGNGWPHYFEGIFISSHTIFDQSYRCPQANGDGRPHYFEEQPGYFFGSHTIFDQS